MLKFRYSFVKIPLAYLQALALLSAGLFILCTQTSCDKPAPTASESTTPATDAGPRSVIGQVINFTSASERYRVSGWGKTEGDFACTEGTSAKLALPMVEDVGSLTVKMTLRGSTGPDLPSQQVEVYANDQKITDWQVADKADFTAQIAGLPKGGGGTLNIELRIPKATSPNSLCAYSIEVTQP
jgi:hypothetical protein